MQNECQSGTRGQFVANHLQNVGDIVRSIPQECPKTMKLKGFWYTAGYCLSSKACPGRRKREKLFSFGGSESGSEGKRGKNYPCDETRGTLRCEMD
jgi:hypothetical protein